MVFNIQNQKINFTSIPNRCSKIHSERGVALIWVAMTLTLVFGIASLVVDIAKLRLVAQNVRDGSDAASMAAAHSLDGSISGWKKSKRAVLSLVKTLKIRGASVDLETTDLTFNLGDKFDVLEDDTRFQRNQAQAGNLLISIERGAYWSNDSGEPTFYSLEGLPASNVTDLRGMPVPLAYSLPVYIVSNAARVTLSLTGVGTVFAGVLGVGNFGKIERVAAAVADEHIEECVVPAAISACALMLEINPLQKRIYNTDKYDAGIQCSRETVITEADPLGPAGSGYYAKRIEGMNRSSLYPRYPYWGTLLNKRAVPLQGLMGVAEPTAGKAAFATNQEFLNVLKSPKACQWVRLGSRFKPLENSAGSGGLFTAGQVEQVEYALRTSIRSGEKSFKEAFGDPLGDEKLLAKNYPFLNRKDKELTLEYGVDGKKLVVNLGPPAQPWHYTNPMCHDYGTDYVGSSNGLPINDPNAPVKEVTLMVIAPSTANPKTNIGAYCDFQSLFGGAVQGTTAPKPNTNPAVVGFVRAKLIDFHLSAFPMDGTVSEAIDNNPENYIATEFDKDKKKGETSETVDANDGSVENALKKQTKEYLQQNLDWLDCEATPKCISEQNPPGCRWEDCKGKPDRPVSTKDIEDMFKGIGGGVECTSQPTNSDLADYESCSGKNADIDRCEKLIGKLDTFGSPAVPKRHCLPEKKTTCFNTSSPDCYEPLAPNRAQYGCGGLRVRLDCSQPLLTTSVLPSEARPALVQ